MREDAMGHVKLVRWAGDGSSWEVRDALPAQEPAAIAEAVRETLENVGLETGERIEVVWER